MDSAYYQLQSLGSAMSTPTGWPPGMLPPAGWFPPPFPPLGGLPFTAAPVGHQQQPQQLHPIEEEEDEQQQQQQHQLVELQPMRAQQRPPPPSHTVHHHYHHVGNENAMPVHAGHYNNYEQPRDVKPLPYFVTRPPSVSSIASSSGSSNYSGMMSAESRQGMPFLHTPSTTPPPDQLSSFYDPAPSGRSSVSQHQQGRGYFVTDPDTTNDDLYNNEQQRTSSRSSVRSNDSPPALRREQKQRGVKRKRQEEDSEKEKEQQKIPRTPVSPLPHQTSVFCKVTGRLSVVGSQRLYCVTTDEIERRTVFPECLNRSHLGPLLRRGKVKGCGDSLEELLRQRNLTSMKSINRKKHPLTTLSALLEEEAVQLTVDHREIAFAQFPFIGIARMMVRGFPAPSILADATGESKAAISTVGPLVALLKECMDADDGGVFSASSPFRPFALATHALGVEEALLMVELYERFLVVLDQEACAQLERVNKAAAAGNYHPLLQNMFPSNTEPCLLPVGHNLVVDDDEDTLGSRQFAENPGRLTLANKKYNVNVAEMLRRVRAPESLNLSILGSLLRKGKTKDNGNSLRDHLAKQGIKIDQGRRKSAKITCFTAMLEGEALSLAEDLDKEVGRSFPFAALSTELNIRYGVSTQHALHCRRLGLEAASRIADAFADQILFLRLPVHDRIPHRVADEAYLIHTYTNLTHGYGPDTCINWMRTLSKLFAFARASLPLASSLPPM